MSEGGASGACWRHASRAPDESSPSTPQAVGDRWPAFLEGFEAMQALVRGDVLLRQLVPGCRPILATRQQRVRAVVAAMHVLGASDHGCLSGKRRPQRQVSGKPSCAWSSAPLTSQTQGARQRVALARALFADPEVLFLDEPTSGLHPAAARDVHELIFGHPVRAKVCWLETEPVLAPSGQPMH